MGKAPHIQEQVTAELISSVQGAPEDTEHLAKERASVELAKLTAETAKLRLDLKYARRNHILEVIKALSALTAIAGIFLTFHAQRQQLSRAETKDRDDSFAELIKRFGDGTSAQTRLTGASALSAYLTASDQRGFAERVRTLFLSSVGVERDPAVRDFIAGALIAASDRSTLQQLVEQNRDFQERIATLLKVPRWVVLHSLVRIDPTVRDSAMQSRFLELASDLEWNISALLRTIAKVRHVKDLDFSEVTLCSITEINNIQRVRRDGVRYYKSLDRYLPRNALVFENVNMTGANLAGLTFDGAKFHNVRMDESVLFRANFWRCDFRDETSIRDFSPALFSEIHVADTEYSATLRQSYIVAPFWYKSHLDVKSLYPLTTATIRNRLLAPRPLFYASTFPLGENVWYHLRESTWTIHDGPPESRQPKHWKGTASKPESWNFELEVR